MSKYLVSKLEHKVEFILAGSVVRVAFAEIQDLRDLSIKEYDDISTGHISEEELYLFIIRYAEDISKKFMIKFKDRIFQIKKITNPGQKNILLRIIAKDIEA